MSKRILILGAKSDIGIAIAHKFAQNGFDVLLAAREKEILLPDKNDLELRYNCKVEILEFDALAFDMHADFFRDIVSVPDVVVSVIGYLGDQLQAQSDFVQAKKIIDTNYTAVVSILTIVANAMVEEKKGSLIVISSVAGDRGRPSNYTYGSSKGALSIFLQGMSARLAKSGINVLDVKPGFVATRMTSSLNLPEKLTVSPNVVAGDVYKAYTKGRAVLYTPWFWTYIMLIIKTIPRFIFNKLNL